MKLNFNMNKMTLNKQKGNSFVKNNSRPNESKIYNSISYESDPYRCIK